jgi:BirA family transcriptional regulator, biotin operon repressor / biotin---[acetyl-CoA-carboxylase] ligase
VRESSQTAVLRRLLPIGTAVSVSEILEQTQTKLSELPLLVRSLEEAGFIFRMTEREISLVAEPDSLVPHAILARLRTMAIGRDIVVFRETSSTNDRVRRAGISGAAEGLAIFAESQTKGRGTYGRKWVSGDGDGLWFSILLRSRMRANELPRLVRLAAVACAEVIERSVGRKVHIKPPNDLVLGNGKLAGFLLETSNGWDFQVLGIGINTRSAPSLPGYPTAAMEQFSMAKISRNALAAELLDGLESWYFNKSGDQVELAFESRCIGEGRAGSPSRPF